MSLLCLLPRAFPFFSCLVHYTILSLPLSHLLSLLPRRLCHVLGVPNPGPGPPPSGRRQARPGPHEGEAKEARRASELFVSSSFLAPFPNLFQRAISLYLFLPPCDAASDLWQGRARHPCFPKTNPLQPYERPTRRQSARAAHVPCGKMLRYICFLLP